MSLRRRGGGRIIQTSSSVGQAPYATMGIDAATKWGSKVPSKARFRRSHPSASR
jgi:hypothetical protein